MDGPTTMKLSLSGSHVKVTSPGSLRNRSVYVVSWHLRREWSRSLFQSGN